MKKLKNVTIILFISIIIILAYSLFFKFHLVSDAYRIIDTDSTFIMTLKLIEGRLVQLLYFTILFILGISINSIDQYLIIYRFNTFLSIILLIFCVFFTYKILEKNINNINNKKRIVLLLCSLLFFINICICEYLLFLENFIMILGLFLAVLAAYLYFSNINYKYLKIFILVLLSSFCYQAVSQLFVILASLILLINTKNNKNSYILKQLLKILTIYFIPLGINYLICCISNYTLPHLDPRLFNGFLNSLNKTFWAENILILSICMFILGFLIILNLKIFNKKNIKQNILNLIYLIIMSIISFTIFAFNHSMGLIIRTILNFIIIYPVLTIYILNEKNENNCTLNTIFTICALIINILCIFNLINLNIVSSKQNINAIQSISQKIEEYEVKNNIKIKNIALYDDSSINYSYWNLHTNFQYTYAVPLYYAYWCDVHSINVISGKHFTKLDSLEIDIEIYDYFKSKNWDELNVNEQLVFKGNTLHLCKF